MDMNLITAATGTKAGAAQVQIATTLMKTNADAERASVMTLLGDATQASNTRASVATGVGGRLDVTA